MLLIVSYHYIGKEDAWPNGGIYPVSVARLKNQIETLSRRFEFIGLNELTAWSRQEKSLPTYACLITFDDGLAQQYELALPLLDRLKIPAGFFVCGLPCAEKKALDVHKMHWCLANLSLDGVYKIFNNYVQKNLDCELETLFVPVPQDAHKLGNNLSKALKYNFYHVFKPSFRERLLKEAFKQIGQDEAKFAADLYMDHHAISDLACRKYLGLHTYRHEPLSKLRTDQIIDDLKMNRAALEKAARCNLGTMGISYPYGRPAFLNETAIQAVARFGASFGLTTLRGFNHNGAAPFWLRRMDTNDVPGGKKPEFEVDDLNQALYEYF
jgi:peptidoglycan/xylan/chitin deacetylase (PgdA/CDA1 family)